jgi:hypothetical protein
VSRTLLVENDPDVLLLIDEVPRGAGYQIDMAEVFRETDNLVALRVRPRCRGPLGRAIALSLS